MRTRSLLAIVLLCPFSAFAQDTDNAAQDQISKARKWLLMDRPRDAEKELRKPRSPQAQAMRALLISVDSSDARMKGQTTFDEVEADKLAREAMPALKSRSSDPISIYLMGSLTSAGLGVEKDEKEGARLVAIAAEKNDPFGCFKLGMFYRYGAGVKEDLVNEIAWIRKAADAGDTRAMVAIAQSYEFGEGVKQSLASALYFFEKAANAGNAEAMIECAQYYKGRSMNFMSLSMPVDPRVYSLKQLAENWEKQSAETGFIDAVNRMAVTYEFAGDLKTSFEWRKKAAASGLPLPVASLARSFRVGIGCPKDVNEAERLSQKAKELAKGDLELLRQIATIENLAPARPFKLGAAPPADEDMGDDVDDSQAAEPDAKPAAKSKAGRRKTPK